MSENVKSSLTQKGERAFVNESNHLMIADCCLKPLIKENEITPHLPHRRTLQSFLLQAHLLFFQPYLLFLKL